MVRQHSTLLRTVLCAGCFLGAIHSAGSAVMYTIQDLGSLSDTS